MRITRDFVFVHMPKTGGGFVKRILGQVYPAGWFERRRQRLLPRHASRAGIPAAHAGLPVVGCVRNPFARYVSQYRFGWWRDHPDGFPFLTAHPRFPELTFEEYVRLCNERPITLQGETYDGDVGLQSLQYLWFYGEDPHTLLRTEHLNRDVYDLLRGFGHDDVEFVLHAPAYRPRGSGATTSNWRDAYTPELWEFVREREQALLSRFPEYDTAR